MLCGGPAELRRGVGKILTIHLQGVEASITSFRCVCEAVEALDVAFDDTNTSLFLQTVERNEEILSETIPEVRAILSARTNFSFVRSLISILIFLEGVCSERISTTE